MVHAAFKLPDHSEVTTAQAAVEALREVQTQKPARIRLVPEQAEAGPEITLPGEALHLLVRILTHMANGHAVTVMPVEAEVTTQKAAEMLGVSRPFLVGLLESGDIPFRKVGTHRRVRVMDVLDYKRRDDAERQQVLDELTAEGQALGMGY
ncbi:MAG: helix-turn-helix domain-containing protein [Myxococcales bacterium]|nr:helix-turn-helix domain-containing protein [Myxococcales bacterium]MCB9523867.1 helix-turn-helix domain-containing protein [Myxococcales bacterium]